jgi:hypothetical protein
MNRGGEIDALIRDSRDLDARAATVQGEREIRIDRDDLEQLIDDYQNWYARALAVLPEEQHAEFKDLYEGGLIVKRIKTFLEAPGTVSVVFDPDEENPLIDYWQHPYEATFHASLLEQRQVLTVAKRTLEAVTVSAEIELVERVGRGLPRVIASLGQRGRNRSPFEVQDEYDVQDLVGGILRVLFEDVRPEDPSPSHAGASTRIDFVLKREEIVVETKMTRDGLGERKVADELIKDIERYRAHPACRTLVAIVYDSERRISNPRGLEDDLRHDEPGFQVRVVVCS